ncbi:MAG: gliding motility-associated C-terminal domain-containing protein [Bacteroidia bacterium]|nr:gliding motility-associated C-terminal domain-containing protein [Bacteroidia bacterium]
MPNPSFEDTINCPSNISQLYNCSNWITPTTGTSDYFNACASVVSGVSIPSNGAGFQQPKNGNAYVGISPYQRSSPTGPFNYREYIQAMLIDSLITNNVYCVSFYLNCASISSISIDKIGLYFSNIPVNSSTSIFLPYTPQIESPVGFYLTDTLGWYKVEGTYTALGGEKYITIGNFRDELATDTIHTDPLFASSAYYYIDDVSVIRCDTTNPFDEASIANIFTPNNDGINEQWVLNNLPEKTQVQIYNRWGVLVAGIAPPFTVQGTYKWDGRTTSGMPCVEGTYFYLISTPEKTYKGFVQLVR